MCFQTKLYVYFLSTFFVLFLNYTAFLYFSILCTFFVLNTFLYFWIILFLYFWNILFYTFETYFFCTFLYTFSVLKLIKCAKSILLVHCMFFILILFLYFINKWNDIKVYLFYTFDFNKSTFFDLIWNDQMYGSKFSRKKYTF